MWHFFICEFSNLKWKIDELSINIIEAMVQLAISLSAQITCFLYTYTSTNWEKCIYWGRQQKKSKEWHNKQSLEYF